VPLMAPPPKCTWCHDMGGHSRQKELEALWRHNRATRKKILTRSEWLKLSPQQLLRIPAQLRHPDKVHGFARPKGLRASTVFQFLLQLSIVWGDKRFDDCISALLEHGIIEIRRHTNEQGEEVVSYEFSNRQGLYADRYNENRQAECLAEVQARIKRGKSERQACREVAAEWGLPGNSFTAAVQRLRDLLRSSKT
jgi:hypothetical protein